MKKILIICTALAVGLFTGCNKNNPEGDGGSAGEMPDVGITAVANPDNTATISATLTAGQFHGAKIVSAVEISTIGDLNYTNEIQLIRYVEENGKEKVYWKAKQGVPHFPKNDHQWLPINTEQLKRVYDEMVTQSGAEVLLFSMMAGVKMKNTKEIDYILVANKEGLTRYRARVYVDCTGDGDLAAFAGADYFYGDDKGRVQASTLCFSIVNVNHDEFKKYGLALQGQSPRSPIHKILATGKYPLITDTHFNVKMVHPGVLMFNAGHLPDVHSTDPGEVTAAMMKGRKIAEEMHRALKTEAPELFGNSYLSVSGALLGVREGRRIKGDYTQ